VVGFWTALRWRLWGLKLCERDCDGDVPDALTGVSPPPAYVAADLTKGFYNEEIGPGGDAEYYADGEHVVVVVVGLRGVVAGRIL
jgi:hypothetical protein